jgi:hypothetical protein
MVLKTRRATRHPHASTRHPSAPLRVQPVLRQASGARPVHYFTAATTSGIDPWHWDYRTCREHRSEDSVAGTTGHLAG